jgi:hypothetical protein
MFFFDNTKESVDNLIWFLKNFKKSVYYLYFWNSLFDFYLNKGLKNI